MAPKMAVMGVAGLLPTFDFQVFVYQVQSVHLLALVFMKTFYLYVKNGFGVNVNVLGFLR